MPSSFLQDDKKNDSSMRLVFIVFMIVTVTLLVIITALVIRTYFSGVGNAEDLTDLIKWLTTGSFGGYLAKVAQKKIEVTEAKPEIKNWFGMPSPPPVLGVNGIVVDRFFESSKKTLSECGIWIDNKFVFYFKGLELPWRNNEVEVSRIPSGTFQAIAAKRPNGKYSIRFLDVIGRTWILIHIANYLRDIRGCIAPGLKFEDIDGDGVMDVSDSLKVMQALEKHFPLGTELTVWVRDKFT